MKGFRSLGAVWTRLILLHESWGLFLTLEKLQVVVQKIILGRRGFFLLPCGPAGSSVLRLMHLAQEPCSFIEGGLQSVGLG